MWLKVPHPHFLAGCLLELLSAPEEHLHFRKSTVGLSHVNFSDLSSVTVLLTLARESSLFLRFVWLDLSPIQESVPTLSSLTSVTLIGKTSFFYVM